MTSKIDDNAVSKEVLKISSRLDNLRFAGLDQNPGGIRDILYCLASKVRKLETSYRALDPLFFEVGTWECFVSPTRTCVYTQHNGEECIFCGEPEERK